MLVASIPYKFSVPWGSSATSSYINTIPVTSSSPLASQTLGFPPATSVPSGAGGTPPDIGDFNGALNYTTLWTQWLQAGAPVGYDSAFSTAIGGYPNGAILASATFGRQWLSAVDNNTSNPDTGGANWRDLFWTGAASLYGGTAGGTANALTIAVPGATSYAQMAGVPVSFTASANGTGAATININSLGAVNILQGGSGLSGGEIVSGWNYEGVFGSGSFHLLGSGAGAVNVGAPSSGAHAANVSWVSANFASLYGNSGNAFNVANATSAAQAVNLGQFLATLSSPGTQVLPNGMIIQWGATTAGAPSSVTFANTFPNACLSVVVSEANAGSGTWGLGKPTVHGATAQNQYGYTAWSETWTGSGWTGALNAQNYIAVGY